jgi:hypothetical protein
LKLSPSIHASCTLFISLPLLLVSQAATFYMCVLFINEVSTVFLNVRFLLLHFDASSSLLYIYNGVALAVSYLVFRVLAISIMVAHAFYSWYVLAIQQGLYWSRPPFDRILFGGLTTLLVVHWAINMFWSQKVFSSVRRALRKQADSRSKSL